MKKLFVIVLMVVALGIMGHFDYEDAVSTAEYDRANKEAVIKDWQVRCSTGDIFDVDICSSVMKGE